ncbi:hypothetical protein ACX3UO_07990 [Corynebacterium coyleae]
MAITLEQAKINTQDDYEATVIGEFRKSSVILDNLIFDTAVNPAGGGSTKCKPAGRLASGFSCMCGNCAYADPKEWRIRTAAAAPEPDRS